MDQGPRLMGRLVGLSFLAIGIALAHAFFRRTSSERPALQDLFLLSAFATPLAGWGTWLLAGRAVTVIDASRRYVRRSIWLFWPWWTRTHLLGEFSAVRLQPVRREDDLYLDRIWLVRRNDLHPVLVCALSTGHWVEAEAFAGKIARLTGLALEGAPSIAAADALGPDLASRLDSLEDIAGPLTGPTPDQGRGSGLFSWLFPLVGLLAVAMGIGLAWRTAAFLRRAEWTVGAVVAVKQCENGGSPVVEFQLPSGRRVRASDYGCSTWAGQVGDEVGVYYDPDLPDHTKLDDALHLWSFPAILCAIGAVFLVFGLRRLALRRRYTRRP
jgi:hypothetical protein